MPGITDFFGLKVPFLKHLGVKAEMAEGGRSRISLELRPELMNSFEVSHGGGRTVDMSLSFIRSVFAPAVLISLLKGSNFGKQLVVYMKIKCESQMHRGTETQKPISRISPYRCVSVLKGF